MLIQSWLSSWQGKSRQRSGRKPSARRIESLEIRALMSASGAMGSTGTGTFVDGRVLPASASVVLGDLDGNGTIDAVSNGVVLLNDGQGNFTVGQPIKFSHRVTQASLGDIDGDGDLDLIVAMDARSGLVNGGFNEVWLNDGHAHFANSHQGLGYGTSYGIKLGDLDGDGDLDAFVTEYDQPSQVWFNDGDGHFTDSGQRLPGELTTGVDLGDLNGDGISRCHCR
ncbi:MAG: FG-GAP-like repeat-containing protein [Planctomycetia bacterium]|nr:FG-GAP-like repeat-containing protein [Planctomycetia bacterium]